MTARQMPTSDDILYAARHRLRAWTLDQIGEALSTAGGARDLPKDGRDAFSGTCALLTLQAYARGDVELFYRAGYSVLDSHKQSQRAKRTRTGDTLHDLIRQYLEEMPAIGPKELWEDFRARALEDHPVIADYDEYAETLLYEPSPGARAVPINFEAFRRRVQKTRKGMQGVSS